jgi:hypothetical protein
MELRPEQRAEQLERRLIRRSRISTPLSRTCPRRVEATAEKRTGDRGPVKMAQEKSPAASSSSCKSYLRGGANTKRKLDNRDLQDKFGGQ